jgi:hypothetical protein
LLFTV